MSENIVIVSGVRTPMGGFQGSLSSLSAVDLGALVIREGWPWVLTAPCAGSDHGLRCPPVCARAGPPGRVECRPALFHQLHHHQQAYAGHEGADAGPMLKAGSIRSWSPGHEHVQRARIRKRGGLRMGHGEIKDHMFLDGLKTPAAVA